jgi:glyoxylase I family protein
LPVQAANVKPTDQDSTPSRSQSYVSAANMNDPPPSPPLPVHHLAIVVTDVERAARFYQNVLGLREIKRWNDAHEQLRSIWCELGNGAFLALERAEQNEPRRIDSSPGMHCIALGIRPDERKSWRERLEREGFVVFRESPYTLYVRDPEGNIIGLSHFPETATDAFGSQAT